MSTPQKTIPPLNPYSIGFLQQVPVLGTILRESARRRNAQQRMEKILQSYREIVEDPRYKIVQEDVQRALGEQLALLVEEAVKCPHCVAFAMPVRMMSEVVSDPIEQVWYENQRARMESESEEAG